MPTAAAFLVRVARRPHVVVDSPPKTFWLNQTTSSRSARKTTWCISVISSDWYRTNERSMANNNASGIASVASHVNTLDMVDKPESPWKT